MVCTKNFDKLNIGLGKKVDCKDLMTKSIEHPQLETNFIYEMFLVGLLSYPVNEYHFTACKRGFHGTQHFIFRLYHFNAAKFLG